MTEARGQPWKPVETDEMREIRMRQILEEALPALLAYMARDAKNMEMMAGGEPVGETSFAEMADFLQDLDQQEVENRIYREWIKGDDTFLVSVLSATAIRAHLSIKKLETGLGESGTEVLDQIKSARSEVEGALSMLLERSRLFAIEYGSKEFQRFLEERKRQHEDLQKHGLRSKKGALERSFFERLSRRDFRAGDRVELRGIMEEMLGDKLSYMELDLVGTLQDKPGMREQLRNHVKALLKLYHLLASVNREIPE